VPQHQDLELLRALAAPSRTTNSNSRHTSTYTNDMAKKRPPKDGGRRRYRDINRAGPGTQPDRVMHPTGCAVAVVAGFARRSPVGDEFVNEDPASVDVLIPRTY